MRHAYERERSFVADASHELRTPIAVVKTELEGALRAGNHEPQVHEALLAAMEDCENLAQLAEDLLVLAKAGDGGLPVRPEALAAAELLETLRRRYADRARASGRSLVVTAQAVTITGDRLRLGQALGNLVDNALRHGAGTITLTARAAPDGGELAVSDDGAGFGEKLASRAFERFARADAARSGEGAGLGPGDRAHHRRGARRSRRHPPPGRVDRQAVAASCGRAARAPFGVLSSGLATVIRHPRPRRYPQTHAQVHRHRRCLPRRPGP